MEVRERGLGWITEMPAALDVPAAAAHQQCRQVEVEVQVAVADTGTIDEERVVKQRSIPVRGRIELFEKVTELPDVVRVDLASIARFSGSFW